MPTVNIPEGFHQEAHILFINGKVNEAINIILNDIKKGTDIRKIDQIAYYYSYSSQYKDALIYYKSYLNFKKNDIKTLGNICSCLYNIGDFVKCIEYCNKIISIDKENYRAFDGLSHCFGVLKNIDKMREAGTKSLIIKDKKFANKSLKIKIPTDEEIKEIILSAKWKKSVCSFSIFGNNPRYLRGALYNVIVGKELFPEWSMRFYVDNTVPSEFKDVIRSLDAEILEQENNQPRDRKFFWRFLVASDPEVGRFMVRDCDSSFSIREAIVVDEWINSEKLFHIIRDWHTHTELILAGLWGGIANIIPNIKNEIDKFLSIYIGTNKNIDQFFLRKTIWSIIKQSCLIHDRYFDSFSPKRPPMKHFRTKDDHIGSNRFAVDRNWQEKCLAPWIRELPCLQIPPTKNK